MARPEEMGAFFDKRSGKYDAHIKKSVAAFKEVYTLVGGTVAGTDRPLEILDIGCGTGLELEEVFRRAPNARITGIDLSPNMLKLMRNRYREQDGQIDIVTASYLDYPLGRAVYDYVISVMTLHHLLPDKKRDLYQRLRESLKDGGTYIEADYIVSPEKEADLLRRFNGLKEADENIDDGTHHIDIPMSLPTLERTLREAGFSTVAVTWSGQDAAVVTARG